MSGPKVLKPILTDIPAELKLLPRWVNWQHELKSDLWKKPPLDPKTGRYASHSDPATWGMFEQAVSRDPYHIGFVLGAGYVGFDQDHCVENHLIQDEARARMMELNTYTELSPSGTGLHSILKGVISQPNKEPWGEIYADQRYFTITGHVLAGYTVIQERDAESFRLKHFIDVGKSDCRGAKPWEKVVITGGKPLPEAKIPETALKLLATVSDPHHGSDDDFACLISMLRVGHSTANCAATFLASPRGRDAEKRKDKIDYYLKYTIYKALLRLELRVFDHDASEPPIEHIDYLLDGHIAPLGCFTYMYGPKGVGKTSICNWITNEATKKDVVVIRLNTEDPERAVLIPGMHKAGVNLKLVRIPDGIGVEGTDSGRLDELDLSQQSHRDALERYIKDTGAKLVIFESIIDFKGKAKANSEDDMRAIFKGLSDIAAHTKAAIIGIGHTNKKMDVSVLDKAMGDGAHTKKARQIIYVQRDTVVNELVRAMDASSNLRLTKNLVFKLVGQPSFELKGVTCDDIFIAVKVEDADDKSADEALDESRTIKKSAADLVAKFLNGYLRGKGWVSTREIERACQQENPEWKFSLIKNVFSRRKLGETKGGGPKTFWTVDLELPLVNGHANGAESSHPAIEESLPEKSLKDVM